jgi:hypothetical protein
VGAALVISFALDYLLVLPAGVRAVFLAAGALCFLVHLRRQVLVPLYRPITDVDLATLLERAHPDLRQSLLTAIELGRPGSETAAHVSPGMIDAVVRDVEEKVERLSFGPVFDTSRLRRKMAGAAAGAGVLLLLAASQAELTSIWLERNVFLGAARWPKGTLLELVSPPVPAIIAVGDSLDVLVRAARGSPSSVVISSWEESGRPVRADTLSETSAGTFRKVFDNIARPFRFRIRGGDDEIGPFSVDVRLRPRIDMQSIQLWCEYPAYTGIAATPPEEPLRHGNLKVPAGTKVRYAMAANVPVREVHFVFVPSGAAKRVVKDPAPPPYNEGEGAAADAQGRTAPGPTAESPAGQPGSSAARPAWPEEGAVALAITGQSSFAGEFTVTETGQYYFQLEGEDGFRNLKPDRFRVDAVLDRVPMVKILEPERMTEEVSPDAAVKVRASASDDYGIERGAIEGLYFPPDSEKGVSQSMGLPRFSLRAGEVPQASGGARGEVTDDLVIEIPGLSTGGAGPPALGGSFQFFVLAADGGGNVGESAVHKLQIVGKEDLLKILTDQLMLVRDQLREVERRQRSARKDLMEFEKSLRGKERLAPADAQKLFRHRQDQERITQALVREVAELNRLLVRTAANKVGDQDWKTWVSGVKDDVNDLARGKSPDITRGLDDLARSAAQTSVDIARVGVFTGGQEELEREIEMIVLRLSEFGDLNAIIQMLREARRRQADLRQETESHVKGEGGAPGGAGNRPGPSLKEPRE